MPLRDVSDLNKQSFDAVVLGGGVQGICVSLQLAARGLRALLLESADFGAGASANSLRILHGGLRYLQSADLPRFYSSVAARRWFLTSFPDLVAPLPCYMPLTRKGLRRPTIMRAALLANDLLSSHRNRGVAPEVRLPASRLCTAGSAGPSSEELSLSPQLPVAVWHDATMRDSARLLMELWHWAQSLGSRHLNYAQPIRLLERAGTVRGLVFRDLVGDGEIEVSAPLVISAAGVSGDEVAKGLGAPTPKELPHVLLWNMLLDSRSSGEAAFALTPDRRDAQTYFMRPWKGRWMVGTGQAVVPSATPAVPDDLMANMLEDLSSTLPDFPFAEENVLKVYAGFLPASSRREDQLSKRPRIVNHGRSGGPSGFFSVATVKYTTAPQVAASVVRMALGRDEAKPAARPEPSSLTRLTADLGVHDLHSWSAQAGTIPWQAIARDESVHYIDDLLVRRCFIADDPGEAWRLAPIIMAQLGWDEPRRGENLRRLATVLRQASPNWSPPHEPSTARAKERIA